MARIYIDGSSTAYGLWGGTTGGWADQLKREYMTLDDRRGFSSVFNFAAPLRDITAIADDMPHYVRQYRLGAKASLGIMMVGMIESRRPGGAEVCAMPIDQFNEELCRLGAAATLNECQLVFIGMPPLDERRTSDFGRTHDAYLNEDRMNYDAAVCNFAAERSMPFIDSQALFNDSSLSEILDRDGLHINTHGHRMVYQAVSPIVARMVNQMEQEARTEKPMLILPGA